MSKGHIDKMFLNDIPLSIDVDRCISKYGGERISFYDTSEVKKKDNEKILNEKNYKKRIAKYLMNVPVLKRWKKDIEDEKEFMEENGLKPIKSKAMLKQRTDIDFDNLSPIEKGIAESYLRKAKLIEKIMADDTLTNQMKLQIYARLSLAHGTEFEQLINYAADYNINAMWFVSVINDAEIGETYENMRDTLRIFAKASEVRQRLDFARELVDGKWHVVMDYGDEKNVPFVLVPAKEIDAIKEFVNNSSVTFEIPEDEIEENASEETL